MVCGTKLEMSCRQNRICLRSPNRFGKAVPVSEARSRPPLRGQHAYGDLSKLFWHVQFRSRNSPAEGLPHVEEAKWKPSRQLVQQPILVGAFPQMPSSPAPSLVLSWGEPDLSPIGHSTVALCCGDAFQTKFGSLMAFGLNQKVSFADERLC